MPTPSQLVPWSVTLRVAGVEATVPQFVDGFELKQVINKPDSITFAVPGDSQIAQYLVELTTDIVVYRGGVRKFRGRVLSIDDDIAENDTYNLTIGALDYSALLQSRMVPPGGLSWRQVDQAQVVWQAIQATQALTSGSLGITSGTLTGGGILRDDTWLEGVPYIGKHIDDMSDNVNGFDWWIDDSLQLQVRSPRRVRDFNDVLNYPGGNVTSVSRKSTASQFRNVVRETGEANTTQVYATALPDTRGRFEASYGNTGVVIQQTLVDKAAGDLAAGSAPRETYIVTLAQGTYGVQFTSELGDIMHVQARRGRLNVDKDCRIVEQSFKVTNDGAELIRLALLAE